VDLHHLRTHCLAKPGTTEERPFGPDTVVFKVMNKMFALCGDDPQPAFVNLKCDPDDALFFRENFEGVKPGYHMDKRLWNSVYLQSDVPETLVREMIDDSYDLIVASLPKKDRNTLESR
jgi:predicted DNA-binding protein (MmcQ/YjbR family)